MRDSGSEKKKKLNLERLRLRVLTDWHLRELVHAAEAPGSVFIQCTKTCKCTAGD
jgi:hypothetical protein